MTRQELINRIKSSKQYQDRTSVAMESSVLTLDRGGSTSQYDDGTVVGQVYSSRGRGWICLSIVIILFFVACLVVLRLVT